MHFYVVCAEILQLFLTRNIVTVGLNVSREVGVLRDGWAVIIQRRELRGDICMSWHKDSRQNWEHVNTLKMC